MIAFAAAHGQVCTVAAVHAGVVQKNTHRRDLANMRLMPFKISVLRNDSELPNVCGIKQIQQVTIMPPPASIQHNINLGNLVLVHLIPFQMITTRSNFELHMVNAL